MRIAIYLVFILTLVSFSSCKLLTSNGRFYPDPKIPVVSIDSLFVAKKVYQGKLHAKRLTLAVSRILDSLSMDSTFVFLPNYKLKENGPSLYAISAKLEAVKVSDDQKPVGSFQGYITDKNTNTTQEAFGCLGTNATDWSCFAFNKNLPDSTDYHNLKSTLEFGCREIFSLVPTHKLLVAKNNEGSPQNISFSLDKLIYSSPKNKIHAAILTQILNNIFVFNQSSYPRKVVKNFTHYNYYNNYRRKNRKKIKAIFQLTASLSITPSNDYKIEFYPKGKDINLVAPEKLNTSITFSKKRIEGNDYSEAMRHMTLFVKEFILMNTLFEQKQ